MTMLSKVMRLRSFIQSPSRQMIVRYLHYVQGQEIKRGIREYFYYIDHQGQLFLDDAKIKNFTSCYKEKDFLVFFFNRLKENKLEKYNDEFPWLSRCGREMNYVRCDDTPIVYTHIIDGMDNRQDQLSYNWGGERMTVLFEPEHVCMLPETGRIYHPAPDQYGKIGLIKSSLAIDLSKLFHFDSDDESQPPSYLSWKGTKYQLSNILIDVVNKRKV